MVIFLFYIRVQRKYLPQFGGLPDHRSVRPLVGPRLLFVHATLELAMSVGLSVSF